jgi:hypothetical protein
LTENLVLTFDYLLIESSKPVSYTDLDTAVSGIRDPVPFDLLHPDILNMIFSDPGSRIPDHGSQFPDPKPIIFRV